MVRCSDCGKISSAKDGEYLRRNGLAGYITQFADEDRVRCDECRVGSSCPELKA